MYRALGGQIRRLRPFHPHGSPYRATMWMDALIARLADGQHGVVARRQLLEIGVTPKAIRVRFERERLHPLYPGVYAVGHRGLTQRGRWMAAVLAVGDGAALSHRSAAALWRLLDEYGAVEVSWPRNALISS